MDSGLKEPAPSDDAQQQSDDGKANSEEDEKIVALRNHIEYLLERNVAGQKDYEKLIKQYKSREQELNSANAKMCEALFQVATLTAQLHVKEDAVKNLKTDVDVLGKQLAEASRAKNNALLKLDNIASREETFENKKRMMEQEIDLLRGQILSFEQRVERQEAELVDATSSSRVVQLESQLQRMIDELAARDQTALRLRNQLKEEQSKVSKLEERHKLDQTKESQLQLIHKKELESQINLSRISQERFEENEKKLHEFSGLIKKLEAELEIKSIPGDAERKALEEINRLNQELENKDNKIQNLELSVSQLEIELEQIKKDNLDQYIQKLFPSASIVSQHLQGDLSLSQLYEKYSAVLEEFNTTKYERDMLRVKFNGLTDDLTVKVDALHECKKKQAAAEQQVQRLMNENKKLMIEYENMKQSAKESARSVAQHLIDKSQLKQQNDDLRKQVIRLVQEIAVLKSGEESQLTDEDHLVLFRDIDELQHKNIELLSLVRELQTRAEAAEKEMENVEKVASCNERLDELVEQVKRYQEREASHSEMMQLLIRQRDHFEEMSKSAIRAAEEKVQQMRMSLTPVKGSEPMDVAASPAPQQPEQRVLSPQVSSPRLQGQQQRPQSPQMSMQRANRPRFSPYTAGGVPPSKAYVDALQLRYKKCQDELESSNKAFAEYRENSKKNMDMVINQLEELRNENLDIKMERSELKALCETGKDKLASMKNIMEGLQRQLDAVQKMRDIQDVIIGKHEKNTIELNKEIVKTYAKLSNVEGLLERANAEIRRLRVSESSARHECESLRASSSSQNLVFLGAQELKAARQRADAEDSLILSNQLQAVMNENKELKQQLESGQVHLKDEINRLEACLNKERALLAGAVAEKETAVSECARAAELLSQAQRDVMVLRTNKNPSASTEVQTENQFDYEHQIGQLEEELLAANARNVEVKAKYEELTETRARDEDVIAQLKKLNDELKHAIDVSKEEFEAEKNAAKQKIDSLEGDLSVAKEQLTVAKEQLCRAEKQIDSLRAEVANAGQRQAVAIVGQEKEEAIRNLKKELAAMKEKQERGEESLEREKEQHKLDLQALSITRKQLVALEKTSLELKERISSLEFEVQKAKSDLENARLTANVVSGDQSDELREQNRILYQQLEQVLSQRGRIESSLGEEDALLGVLSVLRRERDLAQAKADAFEAKAANMQMQIQTLSANHAELSEELARLRVGESNQVTVSRSKYEEYLQMAENLNALTDSSIVQRKKNDDLAKEIAELRPKWKSAMEEIESLKNRNNLFQEKIIAEEEAAKELIEKHRLEVERANQAESKIREMEQKLNSTGSSQQQLSSEISNLKVRINALVQDMTKKNADIRRMTLEKNALQKQLEAAKGLTSKISDELAQEKANVAAKATEIEQLKTSLENTKKEMTAKVNELTGVVNETKESLGKKEKEFEDLNSKHGKVRAIAKKYKDQYDALVAENKDKAAAEAKTGAQEQAKTKEMEGKIAEMQTRLAEAETKATEAENEVQKLSQNLDNISKQLVEKSTQLEQEQKTNAERQNRTKTIIAAARNKIKDQAELIAKKDEAIKEKQEKISHLEGSAQNSGNQDQEDMISQLKKENCELRAQMEQSKQDSKASKPAAGPSGATPSVKIRPMASQSQPPKVKPQTSAAVIPTTRAAPTARLRPMVNTPARNVAVLAPSQQDLPSNSVTPIQGTPRTHSTPPRLPSREEHSSDSSTSLDESAAQSTSANVVLVRPNEVYPAPFSSQPSTSAGPSGPPSAGPSLSLKRARDTETLTIQPDEPQAKQSCTESAEELVPEMVEEPEVEERLEEDPNTEGAVEGEENEEAINEELEEMALQAVDGDDETEENLEEETDETPGEPAVDADGGNAENSLAAAEAASNEEGLQGGGDAEQPAQVDLVPQAAPARANFMLPLLQQGFEEVGDFGIVPSTPTLFVPQRQSGFGEVVSSPYVPQGRHFTFASEPGFSSQSQSASGGPSDTEESAGGHTVPGTPIASSPDDVVPNVHVTDAQASDEAEAGPLEASQEASSSSDAQAPTATPLMQRRIPTGIPSSARNPNYASRGYTFGQRPPLLSRPTPIVWELDPMRQVQGDRSNGRGVRRASGVGAQQRGRGRSRARGPNPFQRGH
ncbi:myosin-2 heavy chain-like isoform X1 [Cloeon dipterum]|uniref:myosin-2 heavy chain-like isoform X1 n=1 Tax=Cloeon dipterum TaxID=197152 RepID=UPI00321F9E52